MKRIIKKKYIIPAFLVTVIAAFLYVYAVYNGYLLLNNPSRTRYPIHGVDVSHYQGDIDWPVLSREKIQFAYIKATEGSSHTDSRFTYNWEQAMQTDLAVGAYHFFSFDSPGHTQAENFIRCVGGYPNMMAPVVDVEFYADKQSNPPDATAVRTELKTMLNELQSHYGKVPVIYSTEDVWELYLKGYFDEYPLWIRNVITKPRKDANWTFWQYTNRGRLKGYSGEEQYIDINVFMGNQTEWQTYLNQ
ncbi:MAG: glycoside hydrolase family 25 protein [Lachnospiraceae bacterium]